MMLSRTRVHLAAVGIVAILAGPFAARSVAQQGTSTQAPETQAVPADLRPLLAAPDSEMRLVTQRYTLDRATLSGNYAGGGRAGGRGGGGGRAGGGAAAAQPAPGGTGAPTGAAGGAPAQPRAPSAAGTVAAPPIVPLSTNRIARLKRFDVNWQAAVGRLDATKLTVKARTDLEALHNLIRTNLQTLEAETEALAAVMPIVPMATEIVHLAESRIRIEDVNAQQAAAAITGVIRGIGEIRAKLEAGLAAAGTADAMRPGRELALRGAVVTDALRSITAEWYGFYNGYDPLFTWWMGLPYKHVDEALSRYAAFLRDKVAASDLPSTLPAPRATPIPPAAAVDDVPNLPEIIALRQDEMRDVVARFLAGTGSGRGGRGGNAAAPVDPKYYVDWLAALKTLDFDTLSRNAQVDYLYLKRTSEARIARASVTLPPNPPRKIDNTGIAGSARGREGLILDLTEEMIPYTPEQLIALANREFAWCEEEMKKASRQMGLGDEWKKAVEKTKESYVPPGGQPALIRDLLFEAIDYLRAKDLITVPRVASESLHMVMMSPQAQLSNPFFLGGSQIQVSYPTDTMEYEARLQSMRGNNPGFSHATAFHEMIPGHNLVGYLGARFRGYRANLGINTPFFGEGWPLYWEVTLYDLGFDKTPAQKVGALFWRMHRCARIIFSLKFHMGQWSPQECIDFLVDRVGHERDNATAEVRRSFSGEYGPLYQAAYLLGGLQLRGLRKELVDSKHMTNRQFHDEVLRQGSMPIALLRLALTKQTLTRDMNIDWPFYGELATH
ncbi:MAG: DUF885 family protein [Acidobacteria bacterium]|nr:DUF885 family protein [Acidobacteriota bacterium]